MSLQKINSIQEQMNDDDNYSDKIKEGGIDQQEKGQFNSNQKVNAKEEKYMC
jgi:hypothetical protein